MTDYCLYSNNSNDSTRSQILINQDNNNPSSSLEAAAGSTQIMMVEQSSAFQNVEAATQQMTTDKVDDNEPRINDKATIRHPSDSKSASMHDDDHHLDPPLKNVSVEKENNCDNHSPGESSSSSKNSPAIYEDNSNRDDDNVDTGGAVDEPVYSSIKNNDNDPPVGHGQDTTTTSSFAAPPHHFLMANPFVNLAAAAGDSSFPFPAGNLTFSQQAADDETSNSANFYLPPGGPAGYRHLLQQYVLRMVGDEQQQRRLDDRTSGASPASEPGDVIYDDMAASVEHLRLSNKQDSSNCNNNNSAVETGVEENHFKYGGNSEQSSTGSRLHEGTSPNRSASPGNHDAEANVPNVEPTSTDDVESSAGSSRKSDKSDVQETSVALNRAEQQDAVCQPRGAAAAAPSRNSPESRTANLIKKQMTEIEKELMRKIQNENIKKMDPSELQEFLSDKRDSPMTNGTTSVDDFCPSRDEHCCSNSSATDNNGLHCHFPTSFHQPQGTTANVAHNQYYSLNEAAHLFHLLRLQSENGSIPWDGKLNNALFHTSPEKETKTLSDLSSAAAAGSNLRPGDLVRLSYVHSQQHPQLAAAQPVGHPFYPMMSTASAVPPFLATPSAAVQNVQQPHFIHAHFPQVPSTDAAGLLQQQLATNNYIPPYLLAAAQWSQGLMGHPAAAFYPPCFIDPRTAAIYQQQQQSLAAATVGNCDVYASSDQLMQQPHVNFAPEGARMTRAASNPPIPTNNIPKQPNLQHDKGSLTNLQSLGSSYDDLNNTPTSGLYSRSYCNHINNNNNINNNVKSSFRPASNGVVNTGKMNESLSSGRIYAAAADGGGGVRKNSNTAVNNGQYKEKSSEPCGRPGEDPVWVLRDSYVRKIASEEIGRSSSTGKLGERSNSGQAGQVDSDTDTETDNLLGLQRLRKYQKVPTTDQPVSPNERLTNNNATGINNQQPNKQKKKKEVMIHEPAVLIEGVLFRAKYLGSTQIICDGRPTKASRMMQAHEAVTRIKVPEGETQPSTDVDLFISTEKIMVLNTDLQRISETDVRQDIMMDHPLRTISYIADIADLVVLMARRVSQASPDDTESVIKKTPKLICHVFESDEAQFIAQSIGQAFQVAYMEFLRANGIEDPAYLREMDYQEVLNSQEMLGEELELFARKETQKDVVVPKQKNEILGMVIVESGWGSMLPTVVVANLMPGGPAARCNQINVGDHIIAVNGISFVGLPLATCQNHIKNVKQCTAVKMILVHTPPVVEVRIKRPDTKYQLGFSVQNGVICSLLRGGIAERGGIRVGHRIIEINGQSVVAVPHEKIVTMLATAVGEIHMKTMPTSMFRLLTGQEQPLYI